MNKEVNFEIAKLLEEKGFDIPCTEGWINYLTSFTGETGMPDDESNLVLDRLGNPHLIERPTIADVIMWLYEKHSIWIGVVNTMKDEWDFNYKHVKSFESLRYVKAIGSKHHSPEEAYEAGIKFALKNLI